MAITGINGVVGSQYPADDVLIDLNAKDSGNGQSDARAAKAGVALFDLDDGSDQCLRRSFGARLSVTSRTKQESVLAVYQGAVEFQDGRRFEDNGGLSQSLRCDEKGQPTEEDSVGSFQVGCLLPGAGHDNELLPEHEVFCHDGLNSTRPQELSDQNEQVNQQQGSSRHGCHHRQAARNYKIE